MDCSRGAIFTGCGFDHLREVSPSFHSPTSIVRSHASGWDWRLKDWELLRLFLLEGQGCLRPGVKGLSENIRVVSLIDRYLEHARIFHFCHGSEDRIFISSADWMSRNLDKRIELLVPIESKTGMEKMIDVLDTYFNDDHKAYQMRSDGTYRRRKRKSPKVNSQAYFQELACKEVADAETRAPISFTPHTSTS